MDKHPLPAKKRYFPVVTISIVAMSVLFSACERARTEPSPAVVASATAATKEQAMAALMALPELKTWSERIEKESGGKLRGALMEYDTQPKVVNGKRYWQFSFVENGSDAARLWESFLVSDSGDDILIDDDESGQPLTLDAWRNARRPMERTGPQ
jgi:hypothetical protein